LRGNFRESEYGDIILPFVFIRRLDAILEKHFNQLQLLINKHKKDNLNLVSIVKKEININFYNSSQFTIKSLLDDPRNINENFDYYINSFSENIKDLINKFKITDDLKTIKEKNILRDFLEKIYLQDLSKENVSNEIMGLIYEELMNGKEVEIYMIRSKKVMASIKGLFGETLKLVSVDFKAMENICKQDYKNIYGKYPEWNFQENKNQWPLNLSEECNVINQRSTDNRKNKNK
jgi:type I restriction-modification system DNA methylase subunit